MKSGLNWVARPRFGPILSGNVAVDSLMLLVASEPPKPTKINEKILMIFSLRVHPLITLSGCGCKNTTNYNVFVT